MTIRNAFCFSILLSSATVLLGCNTFDPSLGNAPFRCGTGTPRCPDGYQCVTNSPTDEVCLLVGGSIDDRPDAGGGGDFTCNDDLQLEPNNSIADPTLTGIPAIRPDTTLVQLAICPSGDEDFFRFDIEVNATNALVEIEYDAQIGTLKLDMLNSSGVSIGTGSPVVGDINILRVAVPNLAQGTYYGQVRGDDSTIQNNYKVTVITTP